MANDVAPLQTSQPPGGGNSSAAGPSVTHEAHVIAEQKWGTSGARMLGAVGRMIDDANQRHTSRARVELMPTPDRNAGRAYGAFRIRDPGLLSTYDIKQAIAASGSDGWTGSVRRDDSGNYIVALRPLVPGQTHLPPDDRYDGRSTKNIWRERQVLPTGPTAPKST